MITDILKIEQEVKSKTKTKGKTSMKSPFQTKTRFSIQTAKKMKRKSQGLPRKLAQQESHKLK
jgi:hypothetical protein